MNTRNICMMSAFSCRRKAVTLVEISVVAVISALILSGATLLWMRTGKTVLKGEEMMDLQLALRSIDDRIRNDIRTLVRIEQVDEDRVRFIALSRKTGGEVNIEYYFEESFNSIRRFVDGVAESFHADGLVARVIFSAHPSLEEFEHMQMALELRSNEKNGENAGQASRLALISRFSSKSIEKPFEIISPD